MALDLNAKNEIGTNNFPFNSGGTVFGSTEVALNLNQTSVIAELIFPDIMDLPDDLEKRYPPRSGNPIVTRFAPSPTGFLHLGNIFTALISERIARTNKDGVFFLRIEDTDKNREVDDTKSSYFEKLGFFNMDINEGTGKGDYGPYIQSERVSLYKVYLKYLIQQGLAYPCFLTEKEIEEISLQQESEKVEKGIYGIYSPRRNKTVKEYTAEIESGKPFTIRLRAPSLSRQIPFSDGVKGQRMLRENTHDFVIAKSDGSFLPTYHFAHAVDDHLMRTTHVVRGEEWRSSLPKHIQLFSYLGRDLPMYLHVPHILKEDEDSGNKRKLSKRKDPEADINYFLDKGYLPEAIVEYLLSIANTGFEDWRSQHPDKHYDKYVFDMKKINTSGALLDMNKLNFISSKLFAHKNIDEIYEGLLAWLERTNFIAYKEEIYNMVSSMEAYTKHILSIDLLDGKKFSRFSTYAGFENLLFFYPSLYGKILEKNRGDGYVTQFFDKKDMFLLYINQSDFTSKNERFQNISNFARQHGFVQKKEFLAGRDEGTIADFVAFFREIVTGGNASNCPETFYTLQLLGKDEIKRRIDLFFFDKI